MTTTIMMYDIMSMDDQVRLEEKYTDAAKSGNLSSLIDCIDQGVPIYTSNNNRDNALHIASLHGNIEIAKYLIDQCSMDINNQHPDLRMHALQYASCKCQLEMCKYLMSYDNIDCNLQDDCGHTALHHSLILGVKDLRLAEYLINESNIDLNVQTNFGETALHIAVDMSVQSHRYEAVPYIAVDYAEMVRLIVKTGRVNVNIQERFGETALHLALKADEMGIARCLMNEGCADPFIMDNHGISACDYLYDSELCNEFIIMLVSGAANTRST